MATDAAADLVPAGPVGVGDRYEDAGERGLFAGIPDTLRDIYEALGVGDLLRAGESPPAPDAAEPDPDPKAK